MLDGYRVPLFISTRSTFYAQKSVINCLVEHDYCKDKLLNCKSFVFLSQSCQVLVLLSLRGARLCCKMYLPFNRMLGLRCTRHLRAQAPSAAAAAFSSMDSGVMDVMTRLPAHIRTKLKSLPADIRATLMSAEYEDSAERSSASTAAAITLPPKLQESAEYYFRQGGKLLRPTVSMLMSDACNDEARRFASFTRLFLNVGHIADQETLKRQTNNQTISIESP